MKVKELIELLKQTDPEKEVAIFAPDRDYYSYGYREYSIDKEGVDVESDKFSISVDD